MSDQWVSLDAIRLAPGKPLQIELAVNHERVAFADTRAARDFANVLHKIANVIDEANNGPRPVARRPKLTMHKGGKRDEQQRDGGG